MNPVPCPPPGPLMVIRPTERETWTPSSRNATGVRLLRPMRRSSPSASLVKPSGGSPRVLPALLAGSVCVRSIARAMDQSAPRRASRFSTRSGVSAYNTPRDSRTD